MSRRKWGLPTRAQKEGGTESQACYSTDERPRDQLGEICSGATESVSRPAIDEAGYILLLHAEVEKRIDF